MLVYVGAANSLDLHVHHLTDEGVLETVATVPVPHPAKQSYAALPLAVTPDGRTVFAAVSAEPFAVSAFRRTADGLDHIASTPLPCSLAYARTDRTGRFLLGASTTEKLVIVSPILADGRVGEDHRVLEPKGDIHAILPDRSNRHVFATDLHGDRLLRLSFDADSGQLALAEEVAIRPRSGPRHLAFSPANDRLFLLNEYDGMVDSFDFDAQSGRLTPRDSVSIMPGNTFGQPRAADLAVTPDGRFLYASERGTNTIAAFRCEADGKLTPLGNFVTENCPRSFAIDPQGRFLLCAGQISHRVKVHAIEAATGALKPLASYRMGRNPSWVEVVA
jgi:6-phosphogluconolactonase